MGHRKFRGQPQYCISFVGYYASESIWLAEEELSNAKELMSVVGVRNAQQGEENLST